MYTGFCGLNSVYLHTLLYLNAISSSQAVEVAATEAAALWGRLVRALVGVVLRGPQIHLLHPRRDHRFANLPPNRFSGRQRKLSD